MDDFALFTDPDQAGKSYYAILTLPEQFTMDDVAAAQDAMRQVCHGYAIGAVRTVAEATECIPPSLRHRLTFGEWRR